MDEPEVKTRLEAWLTRQGYHKGQTNGDYKTRRFGAVFMPEPGTDENRNVRLDYYLYNEKEGKPLITWIECKGDQNLSGLLEGFVRTEYAVWLNGGQGLFVCPTKAAEMLMDVQSFLGKAVSGLISILDIEKEETYQL